MTASNTPAIQIPIRGFGDAAAEPGRKDGWEYWVVASTTMTVFAATSGNSSSLIQYSKVESLSSTTASSMATACGSGSGCETRGTSGAGAEREMTIRGATCGGAERARARCACHFQRKGIQYNDPNDKLYCGIAEIAYHEQDSQYSV